MVLLDGVLVGEARESAVVALERARDVLVLPNFRLVLKDVFRYHPAGMRHSDLFQEGVLGLHKAVFRFDSERGTRFSTYATYWIRQSIRKALIDKARMIRVPQAVQEELRKEESRLNETEANRHRDFCCPRDLRGCCQQDCSHNFDRDSHLYDRSNRDDTRGDDSSPNAPSGPETILYDDYVQFDTTRFMIQRSLEAWPDWEWYVHCEASLGEPFGDANGNGVYDVGIDTFVKSVGPDNMDYNDNGKHDGPDDPWEPGIPFDSDAPDRILAVHRITAVEQIDRPYVVPDNYDFEKSMSGHFGVWQSDPFEVVCECKGWAADYVAEREWSDGQRVRKLDSGGIELSFVARGHEEVARWAMSFGEFVEIKSPPELVDKVSSQLSAAAGLYES